MTLGAFASIENDGSMTLAVETIAYDTPGGNKVVVTNSISFKGTAPFRRYLGKGEIIEELFDQQTSRSKEWMRESIVKLKLQSDPVAFQSQELVRLSIENYPATRKDKDGNPFSVLGGPITSVKLTPSGVVWIAPGACRSSR